MEYLNFGGIDSSIYGVYISSGGAFNAPERAVELIQIPGKNGSIIIEQGRYENISITYPAGIFGTNKEKMAAKLKKFRNALLSKTGYQRLWDSYNPFEFRLAAINNSIEVEGQCVNRHGSFDLIFNAKPQRFLVSGESFISIASGKGITNPTPFNSKPLIHLVGYGQVSIGNYVFTISGSTSMDMYIDCETMEAYSVSGGIITSRNSLLAASTFPELVPGVSGITYAGTITEFEIAPRWWII